MNHITPMNPPEKEPFWKSLFSGGGFNWEFQMRRGDARTFFAPWEDSGKLLATKRTWLDAKPELFTMVSRHGGRLVTAAWNQAVAWGQVALPEDGKSDLPSLARQWEPDLLLLDHETMSFAAACVCFPSSWSPAHTVGKSLHEVHGVVPDLNPRIGEKIERFLRQLQPGKAYCRENWGFTRSAELNYHPDLRRQPLDETVTIGELHLRVEHQLFTGIPGGVLMGIRIGNCPLADLATDPAAWCAVAEKIRSMPEDVAAYKGMRSAREAMLREMRTLAPTG